jgi:hypothetical protein
VAKQWNLSFNKTMCGRLQSCGENLSISSLDFQNRPFIKLGGFVRFFVAS